jgi:hypothetical protein
LNCATFSKEHTEHINAFGGENGKFQNVTACGTYSYLCALKGHSEGKEEVTKKERRKGERY